MNLRQLRIGISSFVLVLLFMPLGHALMVLIESFFIEKKLIGAFVVGLLGAAALFFGASKKRKDSTATILGFLAGVLVWTGWIEFSFVWIAEKTKVAALLENGEVVTKPEYLLMPSSIGFMGAFFLLFLFTKTNCNFFSWVQRTFRINMRIGAVYVKKSLALITFIETVMVLWFFYIVLLLVYDKDIAGDRHIATYIVAFGSLFWSIYLFLHLIRINSFDYAVRYAIPTVIIFWNFIEVMGRWNLFEEIWIRPLQYRAEIIAIVALLTLFIGYYLVENRRRGVPSHGKGES